MTTVLESGKTGLLLIEIERKKTRWSSGFNWAYPNSGEVWDVVMFLICSKIWSRRTFEMSRLRLRDLVRMRHWMVYAWEDKRRFRDERCVDSGSWIADSSEKPPTVVDTCHEPEDYSIGTANGRKSERGNDRTWRRIGHFLLWFYLFGSEEERLTEYCSPSPSRWQNW
jgi:hypothetical protein